MSFPRGLDGRIFMDRDDGEPFRADLAGSRLLAITEPAIIATGRLFETLSASTLSILTNQLTSEPIAWRRWRPLLSVRLHRFGSAVALALIAEGVGLCRPVT